MVGAIDCFMEYNEWKTSLGLIQSQKAKDIKQGVRNKSKKASCIAKYLDKGQESDANQAKYIPKTKLERKHHYNECKQTLSITWDFVSEIESEGINVPSNFKTYTIQDHQIVTQSPKHEKLIILGESYDGLKEVKQLDLAQSGEEPKSMYIATNL